MAENKDTTLIDLLHYGTITALENHLYMLSHIKIHDTLKSQVHLLSSSRQVLLTRLLQHMIYTRYLEIAKTIVGAIVDSCADQLYYEDHNLITGLSHLSLSNATTRRLAQILFCAPPYCYVGDKQDYDAALESVDNNHYTQLILKQQENGTFK
ncbi:hypothetical protein BdWA1_001575 [Babesia duncani]|uniref:Uncharacterized protein n=1 Tax=Babesia duncani TaxID=323732 RepID=A0AAD9UNZ0_9APIC|nr:hypothetical protein BdWA1_001575 [Babesia duncani]